MEQNSRSDEGTRSPPPAGAASGPPSVEPAGASPAQAAAASATADAPAEKKPLSSDDDRKDEKAKLGGPFRYVIGLALLLVLVGLGYGCHRSLDGFLTVLDRVHNATAPGLEHVVLAAGPPEFLQMGACLQYRGTVDDKAKVALLALFPANNQRTQPDAYLRGACDDKGKGAVSCSDIALRYRAAVDRLAFDSVPDRSHLLAKLLLAALFFGALGAHVRSMTAFINHRSKNALDLTRWGPYYYARPFTGAAFGVIVVVIVKAGFLTATGSETDPKLWWISLAFFAGFGDREFGEKIRQISKALFGEGRTVTVVRKDTETPEARTTTTTKTSAGPG